MEKVSRSHPLTLQQIFVAAYGMSMVLLILGVHHLLQNRLTQYLYHDLADNGRVILERLAEESRFSLIQRTAENIQPRLDVIATYPHVLGVLVAPPHGLPLVSKGRALSALDPEQVAQLVKTQTRFTEQVLTLYAPVSEISQSPFEATPYQPLPQPVDASIQPKNPNKLGYVAILFDLAPLQADLARINQYILLVMAFGMVLTTALQLWILRLLTQPISRLAAFMSLPETLGHFRQAPVRGVREAQRIAVAFNTLMMKMAQAHHELDVSRSDLAARVESAVLDLKQQHAELETARRQAEAASRVKSEFIANVSHEIRTPMHGFLGFLDLLGETPLTPTQRSYWRFLKHSVTTLLGLMNKILDFSKLEVGKMTVHLQPFHLPTCLERTVQLFTANAYTKGLSLDLRLQPDLPRWVKGDPQHLRQMLINLLDNAIKFTRQGGVSVVARVASLTDAPAFTFQLTVQDTGVGIPQAYRDQIFGSFNQVDSSTTREQGGTGLGLAICQQLAQLHHGTLDVDSEEQVGSTFTLRLPFDRLAPPTSPTEPDVSPSEWRDPIEVPEEWGRDEDLHRSAFYPHRRSADPIRVLVVDDNLPNRVLVKSVLIGLQAEVVLAESGPAALAACQWHRFDLIVMDLMMPGMSGLETTQRLRAWQANPNRRVPIIGLTGTANEQQSAQWRTVGMNACFVKPISPA